MIVAGHRFRRTIGNRAGVYKPPQEDDEIKGNTCRARGAPPGFGLHVTRKYQGAQTLRDSRRTPRLHHHRRVGRGMAQEAPQAEAVIRPAVVDAL
jgi:hypothetical protein